MREGKVCVCGVCDCATLLYVGCVCVAGFWLRHVYLGHVCVTLPSVRGVFIGCVCVALLFSDLSALSSVFSCAGHHLGSTIVPESGVRLREAGCASRPLSLSLCHWVGCCHLLLKQPEEVVLDVTQLTLHMLLQPHF